MAVRSPHKSKQSAQSFYTNSGPVGGSSLFGNVSKKQASQLIKESLRKFSQGKSVLPRGPKDVMSGLSRPKPKPKLSK